MSDWLLWIGMLVFIGVFSVLIVATIEWHEERRRRR